MERPIKYPPPPWGLVRMPIVSSQRWSEWTDSARKFVLPIQHLLFRTEIQEPPCQVSCGLRVPSFVCIRILHGKF